MPKGKPIPVEKRSAILTLHEEGYSVRIIAEKLLLSKSTVHYTIRRYQTTGTLQHRNRSARSRVTTLAEDRRLKVLSMRNRQLTASEIAAEINRERERPISLTITKRRLREAGLYGRVAVKKPLLRRGNRQKRLQWAKKYRN